jgi:hypothetical protein
MLCDRTETEASTVEQYAKQNDQDAIRSEAGAGNTQSWRKEQLLSTRSIRTTDGVGSLSAVRTKKEREQRDGSVASGRGTRKGEVGGTRKGEVGGTRKGRSGRDKLRRHALG